MLEIKELSEASVIYVNLDPDKVETAMRKAGYDEEEYFEFIYDKYGFEDGEDFQTGNDHLELGFYSDTNKSKLNKLKKDLGEEVELSKFKKAEINESSSDKVEVNKMLEIRELSEAGFTADGKEYKCAWGRYSCDGEPITKDEYHKAKEKADGGKSSNKSDKEDKSDKPSDTSSKDSKDKKVVKKEKHKYEDDFDALADKIKPKKPSSNYPRNYPGMQRKWDQYENDKQEKDMYKTMSTLQKKGLSPEEGIKYFEKEKEKAEKSANNFGKWDSAEPRARTKARSAAWDKVYGFDSKIDLVKRYMDKNK